MPNSIKEIPARFCAWWAGYWTAVTSAFRGMSKDNLTMIASGMVYSTLIAIVPCLTFLFPPALALVAYCFYRAKKAEKGGAR